MRARACVRVSMSVCVEQVNVHMHMVLYLCPRQCVRWALLKRLAPGLKM